MPVTVLVMIVALFKVLADVRHFAAGLCRVVARNGFGFLLHDRAGFIVIDNLDLGAVLDRFDLGLGRADLHLDEGVALGEVVVGKLVAVDGCEGRAR
ncbi:MAG: hypothetical protein EOO00_00155 [Chitinophagaceae bacterium]|nr:MAG: hypothetical protein EOO00_00155 [Chitinophagaceae bacterium]